MFTLHSTQAFHDGNFDATSDLTFAGAKRAEEFVRGAIAALTDDFSLLDDPALNTNEPIWLS